ncbi:MAG: leucine-rich repeat protein, partial [Clostridia bacterium]|nr:leucine-rich repeat protein [Clostridia bacterium]
MKTNLSKILFSIMFTLLVFAGGGIFGACQKGSAKIDGTPSKPSVVYEGDILPFEFDDDTLVKYTGEQNAIVEIPSTYSIDEYGNAVAGDTYEIKKIGSEAFKGVKFFDAYIDMSNVTEVGERAFEEVQNLTLSEMPNLRSVKMKGFYKARVNFENMDFGNVTEFGEFSFAKTENYEVPTDSTLKEVHAYDKDGTSTLTLCANNTMVNLTSSAFQSNTTITNLNFGNGITKCESPIMSGGLGTFGGCSNLQKVIFGNGSYKLGSGMFQSCSNLRQVDMQNAYVDELPYVCFGYCSNLVAVNLPPTIKTHVYVTDPTYIGAFYSCAKLKNVNRQTTPYSYGAQDGHTTIATDSSNGRINFCFASSVYCPLTSFIVPATVTSMQQGAFCGFNKLTELVVPFIGRNMTDATDVAGGYGNFGFIFGNTSFTGATYTNQSAASWYIPDSLTKVVMLSKRDRTTAWAFMNMTHLTQVIIQNGGVNFVNLTGSTFKGCTSLTSVTLPNTITAFGGSVVYGCTGITNISVPTSVTSIGTYTFYNCSNLVAVNIKISSITSWDTTYAFYGCSKLTKIQRNSTAQTSGGYLNFLDYNPNTSLTTFYAPGNTVTIYESAFEDWTNLQTINNVANVYYIYDSAFSGCTSLYSSCVSAMYNLKEIGNSYGYSFSGCNSSNFTSITLPSGFLKLSAYSFNNCTNLSTLKIPASTKYIYSHCCEGTAINYQGYISDNNSIGQNAVISAGFIYNFDVSTVFKIEYLDLRLSSNFSVSLWHTYVGNAPYLDTLLVDAAGAYGYGTLNPFAFVYFNTPGLVGNSNFYTASNSNTAVPKSLRYV